MNSASSESIPVIIPAFNEALYIGAVLQALPRNLVEPLVVVNGSSDETAQIAKGFGVTVMELEEQGKLPAIQASLRTLGMNALEPLIILDGDTRPLFPTRWHRGFAQVLARDDDQRPVAAGGPVIFSHAGIVDGSLKSLRRLHRAHKSRLWDGTKQAGHGGPQMGLHIKNEETLEGLLALPHIWPGEDIAIVDAIVKGNGHFYQPTSLSMLASAPSSSSYVTEFTRWRLGVEESRKRVQAAYIARGNPEAIPYNIYKQMNAE